MWRFYLLFLWTLNVVAAEHWEVQLEHMPLNYLLQTLATIGHQNIALSQHISGKLDIHLNQINKEGLWDFLIKTQHLQVLNEDEILWIDKAYSFYPIDKDNHSLPQIEHQRISLRALEIEKLRFLLKDKNNGILSPIGSIVFDERSNSLWVTDLHEYVDRLKTFIQQIDTQAKQIEIEARIVSINRNYAKDLGIRLGFTQPGLFSGELAGLKEIKSNEPALNINLSAIPLEATPMSFALSIAKLGQQYIDAELSFLEGRGKAEIIASPRLVTENLHEATISSGEDIPYQESSLNGATSVSFKKALLLLKVKPSILHNQQLVLALQINQDADSGRRVQGVPIISTKSMTTKVVLHSGETLVLGGIQKNDVHYERVGMPILKDLPLLGRLLSREQKRNIQEELLLFITPRIIYS